MKRAVISVVALGSLLGCQSLPQGPSYKKTVFQKGITFFSPSPGYLLKSESEISLEKLSLTGANWVSFVATGYQDNIASTEISATLASSSDEELIHIIKQARSLGLKVMLKPHVDLVSDAAIHWRGEIGKKFKKEQDWAAWFSSYRKFVNRYAELAQTHGVDQFCVGTELTETVSRESDWRDVIGEVRERYHGPLVYAANHSAEEEKVSWWDALDFIGVDAYYPLTKKNNPSLKELKKAWKPRVSVLKGLSLKWGKQVLITEIGYQSRDGTNKTPWSVEGSIDVDEQADAYRAIFETFFNEPWIAGIHLWAWSSEPSVGGVCDKSFSPYNKPAENVLRKWFGVPQKKLILRECP